MVEARARLSIIEKLSAARLAQDQPILDPGDADKVVLVRGDTTPVSIVEDDS